MQIEIWTERKNKIGMCVCVFIIIIIIIIKYDKE